MAKKDLSKILKTGSLKQRLQLLDEVRAEVRLGREILSGREHQELIDSFTKPEEIRLYNQHLHAYKAFVDFLAGVETSYLAYKEAIAYIIGFTLLWDTYERSEELLNRVIAQVTDKKTKDLIRKQFVDRHHFLYADIETDKDGFLRFYTDSTSTKAKPRANDYSIEGILRLWKKNAEDRARDTKTIAKVLLDYMDTSDYKPKAFYGKILGILEDVNKDKSLFPKFSKQRAVAELDGDLDLLAKYFVYPDPENTEILEDEYDRLAQSFRSVVNNA